MSGGPAAGDRLAPAEVRTQVRGAPGALYRHAAWESAYPGLACGITAADAGADYGLTTAGTPWALSERIEGLAASLGFEAAAMVRQVHRTRVIGVESPPTGGLLLAGAADGMATHERGLLLVVTAADCVPVYLLDPDSGTIGLLHAGWRGAAGGVLEAGVEAMQRQAGVGAAGLRVHLGPAICGDCYEVGPEVLEAFGLEAEGPGHVDIRGQLVRRALSLGVRADAIGVSPWCTRCRADLFHSHRGSEGRAGRMAAFLGWHPLRR